MPHTFTESAARRIVNGIRKVEGVPQDRTGEKPPRRLETTTFWAEIVAESPSDPGHYSWRKQTPTDGELEDWPDDITSGSDYTATEMNERTGLVAGDKILLHFVGYDASEKGRYLFQLDKLPQPEFQRMAVVATADNVLGADWIRGHGLVANPAS